jgi:probable F420-dependent oxidoreductase
MADIAGVRTAVQRLDDAGFDHVTMSGHLLTAEPERYSQFPSEAYAIAFRDPFVLISNLAAVTEHIAFRTSILILPMMPTALVAKQSADLSLISGGRFELGVGLSWQEAEYQAMGQPMRDRGAKLAEQITVLRRLWSEPTVTFSGRFHEIDRLGLGQLPSSPIPLWIGCSDADGPLQRVAELADGWLPGPPLTGPEAGQRLAGFASAAGRSVSLAARIGANPDPAKLVASAQRQLEWGATELTIAARSGTSIDDAVAAMIAGRDAITRG